MDIVIIQKEAFGKMLARFNSFTELVDSHPCKVGK